MSACQCRGRGFGSFSGKIPHTTGQLGLYTATSEAWAPWSLCSAAGEAVVVRGLGTEIR